MTTNNAIGKQAFIIVGLNYGDEGKGTTVDFLTRQFGAHTVVRYNGGAQAAHHVVTEDGRVHCFAQFGSGTLVEGTRTYLSRFMLVNPVNLRHEERGLRRIGVKDAYQRLFIDEQTLIITPLHRYLNRILEIERGTGRHGSCGQGIWETYKAARDFPDEAIYAKDLLKAGRLAAKLDRLRERVIHQLSAILIGLRHERAEAEGYLREISDENFVINVVNDMRADIAHLQIVPQAHLADFLRQKGTVVFEGAQGVLLDAWHGFFPFVTGTDTTLRNADKLLAECGYDGTVSRLGILRAYMTRHGAGPFVTESDLVGKAIPEQHNQSGRWQGDFRIGWFDTVATKYAIELVEQLSGPLDGLVITGLDRLPSLREVKVCTAYRRHDGELINWLKLDLLASRDEQTALTGMMMGLTPDYEAVELRGIDYAQWLAHKLGVPLFAWSEGPTAQSKHLLTAKAKVAFRAPAALRQTAQAGILVGQGG